MIAEKIPGVQALSPQEKLILANELWDEVEASRGDSPTQAAILELLEHRFAEYQRDPSSAVSWEKFKTRFERPTSPQ